MMGNTKHTHVYSQTQSNRQGTVFGVLAVLIWGGYLAVSRYGLTASTLEAIDIAFIRATVAGLTMLLWLTVKGTRGINSIRNVGLTKTLLLTVFVGPPFVYISVSGYAYAPLVHGGVLLPAGLVLAGLILSPLLGDKIESSKIIGVIIMLIGLGLLAGPDLFNGGMMALLGDFLFFTAGVMWASFAVAQKSWQIAPVVATAVVSILSICLYSPIYLLLYGIERLQTVPIQQLVIQGVVQGLLAGVAAMICFGLAVKMIGAAKASLFPALLPVTTLLIGIPLTGELPTYYQAVGTAIILMGLLYALIPAQKTP